MELHAEEAGRVTQARKNDPRITKVGRFIRKTSLDELPQFINVIKGDMSIVGPRPHAFEHDEIYKNKVNLYMQRYQVKPGITGLAQISGFRGETDSLDKMMKRVSVDIEYIENRSFTGDLIIVLKTPFSLFTENAY
jgi:putative colanic acid biosynthesis UDP-glucose lipid carrier transferase